MLKPSKLWLLAPVLAVVAVSGWFVFQLQGSPRLSGIARDADTRAPLAGVVLVASADEPRPHAQATTNAQGEYALNLERNESNVTASLDGYLPAQFQMAGDQLLNRDYHLDLELAPNRLIGYVLDAETNRPLPDAPLRVGEQVSQANSQGLFELRGVKLGTQIAAESPGYQPKTITFDGTPTFNIALDPTLLSVAVVDLGGQPIANAQVEAGDVAGVTDAEGHAVLHGVKPDATVRASAIGFDAATSPISDDAVQLSLRPNTLDGAITDAVTGKPIPGTLVYFGKDIISANNQGAYHLNNLPDETTLTFMAPGYRKTQITVSRASRRDVKLQPFPVRGIHLPFGMPTDRVKASLDMVKQTDLNAIVLDVKGEKGNVGWASQVPLAKQIAAPYLGGIDLHEFVALCHAQSVYCIARMPVFQDTLLATKRPDFALRFPNGTIFHDNAESAWTNAANSQVWDYNIALAKEVAAMGFDEVQFDYIRFPGHVEGLYTGIIATEEGRRGAIAGFLKRAQKELRPLGVFISADVFGLTTAVDDEQYTGQVLKDLGPYLDYISPMVYPDVWTQASYLLSYGLKIANCTEAVRCPYDVIFNSYKRASEKTSAKVRLWLQAYSGRGNFGITEYRVQRKAAEDASSVGWMFWNGPGSYDARMFGPPEGQ